MKSVVFFDFIHVKYYTGTLKRLLNILDISKQKINFKMGKRPSFLFRKICVYSLKKEVATW